MRDVNDNGGEYVYREQKLPPVTVPVQPRQTGRYTSARQVFPWQTDPGAVRSGRFVSDMRLFAGIENTNESDLNDKIVFYRMFPTYADMDRQTKDAYFAFRTLARRGDIRSDAPVSFARVFAYELLSVSGVADPRTAYGLLKRLGREFDDPVFKADIAVWLRDFVVVYNLDESCAADAFGDIIRLDLLKQKLLYYKTVSDAELFSAICEFSTYGPEKSPLYKEKPEVFASAVAAVYRKMAEYYAGRHMGRLSQHIVGVKMLYDVDIFRNALYIDPPRESGCRYTVDAARSYYYISNRWRVDSIGNYPVPPKSSLLGIIIHETDRLTRQSYGIGRPIKQRKTEPWMAEIIAGALAGFIKAQREASRPKISIDTSVLESIRESADITRARLLEGTEEEYAPDEAEIAGSVPAPEPAVPEQRPEGSVFGLLDEDEREFLRLCLSGGDAAAYAKSRQQFPAVVADSINEKLFDLFGDTVIEEIDGRFECVEEYREELE